MKTVYILSEKEEWDAGLIHALRKNKFQCKVWTLHNLQIHLSRNPPSLEESIFINRFSPSFFQREDGHKNTLGSVRGVVRWLESNGHRVINGTQAVELEASKVAQYIACRQVGLRAPYTVMVVGGEVAWRNALEEWRRRPLHSSASSLVVKPNCGGSGQNVRVFKNTEALEEALTRDIDWFVGISIDGVALMQDMVESSFMYRLEFIGGKLLYAVKIQTQSSSLNRCPCELNLSGTCTLASKFEIDSSFPHNESEWMLVQTLTRMLRINNVCIAGIEIIQDAQRRWWIIDCNCVNTNYNVVAEKNAGIPVGGHNYIAQWLGARLTPPPAAPEEEAG